jgi:hypothetical protein
MKTHSADDSNLIADEIDVTHGDPCNISRHNMVTRQGGTPGDDSLKKFCERILTIRDN